MIVPRKFVLAIALDMDTAGMGNASVRSNGLERIVVCLGATVLRTLIVARRTASACATRAGLDFVAMCSCAPMTALVTAFASTALVTVFQIPAGATVRLIARVHLVSMKAFVAPTTANV